MGSKKRQEFAQGFRPLVAAVIVGLAAGAGLAPFAFGKAYDLHTSYVLVLNVVIVTSLLGGLMMLALGRYPDLRIRPDPPQ